MCSPTVDTSRADATAERLQGLSENQFKWVQQQWEADAPNRADATARAGEVSDAQLELMRTATQQSRDSENYRRTVFEPLERGIVSDAQGYDTQARREEAAGKASGDVAQSFSASRGIAARDMGRAGVNPADGAYAGMQTDLQRSEALARADAENKARTQVETIGAARKADAANLGRGLATTSGTQAGLALTAGNGSVNTATIPSQVTAGGVGMVNQGFGMAANGLGQVANIYQQSSNTQAQAGAQGGAAIGGLANAGMMAFAL